MNKSSPASNLSRLTALLIALAPSAATAARAQPVGLGVSLSTSWLRTGSLYNPNGDRRSGSNYLDDRTWLFDLQARYALDSLLAGLYTTLDLPFVRASANARGAEKQSFSIGDASIAVGYLVGDPKNENSRRVGGQLRFKGATGKWRQLSDDETPLGSGHHSLQLQLLSERSRAPGFGVDADVGYIFTFRKPAGSGQSENPGDVLYAEIGLSYRVAKHIVPRITTLLHVITSTAYGPKDGILTKERGSDGYSLALMADVTYEVTTVWTLYAGYGASAIAEGLNLHKGFTVLGKNVRAPGPILTVGAHGKW